MRSIFGPPCSRSISTITGPRKIIGIGSSHVRRAARH
jgi:hypothetical protein